MIISLVFSWAHWLTEHSIKAIQEDMLDYLAMQAPSDDAAAVHAAVLYRSTATILKAAFRSVLAFKRLSDRGTDLWSVACQGHR